MFAQTPVIPAPAAPFIVLSEVDSTNNYAMAKLHAGMLLSGTCILALQQTSGKGQRGKTWRSEAGQNITMSTVFSPLRSLSAQALTKIHSYPFLLSASIALGCYEFIKACGATDITIKWPNDIYIGDRKAAGILIENVYRGSEWNWAIAGTGINVNQTDFSNLGKAATSLTLETNQTYNIPAAGKELHRLISTRYALMETTSAENIIAEYNSVLFKRGQEVKLRKNNVLFTTTIDRVNMDGLLLTADNLKRSFVSGEVELVIG